MVVNRQCNYNDPFVNQLLRRLNKNKILLPHTAKIYSFYDFFLAFFVEKEVLICSSTTANNQLLVIADGHMETSFNKTPLS